MRIVICDDDEIFARSLQDQILNLCGKKEKLVTTEYFSRPMQLLSEVEFDSKTVFFLDIDMPVVSGFDLAEEIHRQDSTALVVFVSSRDDLVFDSFLYRPLYFVRKSCLYEELPELLNSLYNSLYPHPRLVTLESSLGEVQVDIPQVEYAESVKNYLNLYTDGRIIRIRKTIKSLEKEWKNYGFVRCHAAYLVNYRFIKSYIATEITLSTGTVLPISRGKLRELREQIMEGILNVK